MTPTLDGPQPSIPTPLSVSASPVQDQARYASVQRRTETCARNQEMVGR